MARTVTEARQTGWRALLARWQDALLLLLAVLFLAYLAHRSDSGPPAGARAASFELPLVGADGRFRFDGPRDRPLLVEAFASWCGACRRSGSIVEGLEEASDGEKLDILLVSVDDSSSAALRAKQSWPIGLPVAFDERGAFQRAYGISVLPTFVLIGTDGRILDVSTGPPGASTIRGWLRAGDP